MGGKSTITVSLFGMLGNFLLPQLNAPFKENLAWSPK